MIKGGSSREHSIGSIRANQIPVAKTLIENGADLDAKISDGWCPLFQAVVSNELSCVELLIDKGAGVNEKHHGATALHFASSNGFADIVRLLIDRGADVNVKGSGGMTPLCECIFSEDISVVRLLLENGANPKLANEEGFTPLHVAAQENLPEIARLLMEYGAPCGTKSKDGTVPTDLAVKSGAREIVNLLRQCGGD